jgi:valyl-tRNA synthetase
MYITERIARARENMEARGIVCKEHIKEDSNHRVTSYKEKIELAKQAIVIVKRLKDRLVAYENSKIK